MAERLEIFASGLFQIGDNKTEDAAGRQDPKVSAIALSKASRERCSRTWLQ